MHPRFLSLNIASVAALVLVGTLPAAGQELPAEASAAASDPPTAQAHQISRTSGKIDLQDFHVNDVRVSCADGTPSGEAVLYPFLVPEGGSVVYNVIGADKSMSINYDPFKSNPYDGVLALTVGNPHPTDNYAIQVKYLCSADNPSPVATVDATSVSDVTPTSATLKALVTTPPLSSDWPIGYWAEYGTGYARYTSHSAEATFTAPSGTRMHQEVSIKLDNLLPGTVYHYRIGVASRLHTDWGFNSYSGADLTFTTAGLATPTAAPTVKWWAQHAPFGTKWKANTQVRYAVSFVDDAGESGRGPWGPWGGASWALGYLTDIPTDPAGRATARKIYRQFQGGEPELIGTIANNTDTEYQDENY
jgi:hypothetical protein